MAVTAALIPKGTTLRRTTRLVVQTVFSFFETTADGLRRCSAAVVESLTRPRTFVSLAVGVAMWAPPPAMGLPLTARLVVGIGCGASFAAILGLVAPPGV